MHFLKKLWASFKKWLKGMDNEWDHLMAQDDVVEKVPVDGIVRECKDLDP